MSLLCGECSHGIIYGEPLHLAVTNPAKGGVAVCATCLERVPVALRHRTTEPRVGALTVYDATSTENFNGSYTWSGLKRGAPRWWTPVSAVIVRLTRLAAKCGLVEPSQSDVATRRRGLEIQVLLVGSPAGGMSQRTRRPKRKRRRS